MRPLSTRIESPTSSDGLDGLIASRFEIVRRLGDGAFAVVYEAIDRDLDRRVALKLFSTFASDELESALREARAMARINHHNVLSVHDIGQHRGTPFLAFEYAQTDLQRWLATGPRDVDDIMRLFCEAGTGLAAAHAAGLVHHDFKPANVLLRADGSVAVGDFGLARHLDTLDQACVSKPDSESVLDEPPGQGDHFAVGTLRYIAPERLLGDPGDDRSDQFSFCVALWEALAGERPFAGPDAQRRYDSIAAGPTGTPRAAAHVTRALRRGMSIEPADRFETMDALLWSLTPANYAHAGRASHGSHARPHRGWLRRSVRPATTAAMLGAVFLLGIGVAREAPALDVVITPTSVLTADAAMDQAHELIRDGEYAKTIPLLMVTMPVIRETDTAHQREYLAQIEVLGDLLGTADANTQAAIFYAAAKNLCKDLGAEPTRLINKGSTVVAKARRQKRAASPPSATGSK